jgi:hypothetical protein
MGLAWQAYGWGHLAKSIHGYYLVYRNFDNESGSDRFGEQVSRTRECLLPPFRAQCVTPDTFWSKLFGQTKHTCFRGRVVRSTENTAPGLNGNRGSARN